MMMKVAKVLCCLVPLAVASLSTGCGDDESNDNALPTPAVCENPIPSYTVTADPVAAAAICNAMYAKACTRIFNGCEEVFADIYSQYADEAECAADMGAYYCDGDFSNLHVNEQKAASCLSAMDVISCDALYEAFPADCNLGLSLLPPATTGCTTVTPGTEAAPTVIDASIAADEATTLQRDGADTAPIPAKTFCMCANAGTLLALSVDAAESNSIQDSQVWLFDPNGNLIMSNDDRTTSDYFSSIPRAMAGHTGPYMVVVTTYNGADDVGSFKLTVVAK